MASSPGISDLGTLLAETQDCTVQQRIEIWSAWIRDNPGHPNLGVVERMILQEREALSKDQLIASLRQEAVSKDQVIASLEQEIALRSLISLKTNYPALRDCTISGPHLSKNHPHADINTLDGDFLQAVDSNWLDEDFWRTTFADRSSFRTCSSESEAQCFVVLLLEAVLVGLKLDKYVGIAQNRTLAGCECDVLLVYKPNFLPFAVIEVKKPCNTAEQRNQVWKGIRKAKTTKRTNVVAGQIFDAMTSIRLFGFSRVCGMIATGNQWRLVGTYTEDDPDNLETANKAIQGSMKLETSTGKTVLSVIAQFQSSDSSNRNNTGSPEQPCVEFISEAISSRRNSGGSIAHRVIWASKITPSIEPQDDENQLVKGVEAAGGPIISLISLFVVQSCKLLLEYLGRNSVWQPNPSIRIHPKMPCRLLMAQNLRVFAFSTIRLKKQPKLDSFIQEGTRQLFVIHHLGMGASGNCCLAVTRNGGSCCAIKFYHHNLQEQDQLAGRELDNWNSVYGKVNNFPKCKVWRVAGGPCLIMPYLHPIPAVERQTRLTDGSIKKALQMFAKSGFVHEDVKWRHLGKWNMGTPNEIIVLLDLGLIRKVRDELEGESWCTESFEKLKQSAARPPIAAAESTPSNGTRKRQKTEQQKNGTIINGCHG
jgi:hypothetical protein